jgi:predicted transposase YbfD/YdcC
MDRHPTPSIAHHFRDLPDPRQAGSCDHDLIDIVVIAICAVICGHYARAEIAFRGPDHAPWLKTFLRPRNGIPSHDCFRHVFTRLGPQAFQRCFAAWIEALPRVAGLRHIAIDGKSLCGSRGPGKAALHLVSAWASANHLTLGQVAVGDKSNEITAIPRLPEVPQLHGAVVTIDAGGCRKEIAAQVRGQGGDRVLAAKDNQPRPLEDIRAALSKHLDQTEAVDDGSRVETVDRGHGRRGVRARTLVTDLGLVRDRESWRGPHGVCLAVNERTVDGVTSVEARCYIGGLHGAVEDYARAIGGHWSIENGCRRALDVTFGEDACRNRAEHGAEDLAWLRRMALSLLKNDTTCDRSLRGKSAKALADHDFLPQLLFKVTGEEECT